MSDVDEGKTVLEIAPKGSTDYRPCLTFSAPIDYNVHFFMASGGGPSGRRRIDINRVMFYDNEDEIEGEKEEIENRGKRVDVSNASISELLISGDLNAAIFKNEEQGRLAYNDNLLAYNGKYAQLVGKFHANEDAIETILASLPTLEVVDKIQKDIHEFRDH